MTNRQRAMLYISIFVTVFVVLMVYIQIDSTKDAEVENRMVAKYVGMVQFKGKVIKSKIYEYSGKPYVMVCVQLDYSNIKQFYVLNQYCFLKIKDNIATMALGVLDPYLGVPKYVEVNIGNNDIQKYVYKDGSSDNYGLSLANHNLTSADMNLCN